MRSIIFKVSGNMFGMAHGPLFSIGPNPWSLSFTAPLWSGQEPTKVDLEMVIGRKPFLLKSSIFLSCSVSFK